MKHKYWPLYLIIVATTFLTARGSLWAKSKNLVEAQIAVESSGNHAVVGDKNLKNKAYGPLQIRQPCVDDVNRVFGKEIGRPLKAEECRNNLELSKWIQNRYFEIWATPERLGRPVTDEDRIRIWVGGPNGWKRSSTLTHWLKVKKEMES